MARTSSTKKFTKATSMNKQATLKVKVLSMKLVTRKFQTLEKSFSKQKEICVIAKNWTITSRLRNLLTFPTPRK